MPAPASHSVRSQAVALCLLTLPASALAEFTLNWTPLTSGPSDGGGTSYFNCNRPDSGAGVNCTSHDGGATNGTVDPDKTPFLQEVVTDVDGKRYFHVIVGLPPGPGEDGFAHETFIQVQDGTTACGNTYCPYAGGSYNAFSGSGDAPLSADLTLTGNGTADPTKVITRQVIVDSAMGLTQEFIKSSFTAKPKITQSVVSSDLSTSFTLDMSNSGYSDLSTPGTMTNTLTFTDPAIPGGFDAATIPSSGIQITGGRYTYTGPGQWDSSGFTPGSYSYWDNGGFDTSTAQWSSFRDDAQNPLSYTSGGTQTRNEAGNTCKTTSAGSGGC
ncbi:MAG TPA: hypothetical protein ENJ19_11750 [Gammaproteobacteria bacterium]|nr:hypothetical protein [Gammaproteobacteria bacterium]